MIKHNQAPRIRVGILTASNIRIRLDGQYLNESNEQELQGVIQFANCEGKIELTVNHDVTGRYDAVSLDPVNQDKSSFTVFDVTIGIGFHWEEKENQVFRGSLKVIPSGENLILINDIPVEDYLVSVISSEMRATSSPEMLKAHAVISRSWLLAQIDKEKKLKSGNSQYNSTFISDDEIIRWYDREDHNGFDVCADDHCQRYQGITRAFTDAATSAVVSTAGEVLMHNDSLCDARFSKCCGGVTELFENAWEPVAHPYLQSVYDNDSDVRNVPFDLTVEKNAANWIRSSPEAFCNTRDKQILSQVLNDYDQKTHNFYRWNVSYTADEVGQILTQKTGIDFGEIIDLIPVERGASGRLIRLKIIGSKKSMMIGKELEIRKALSPTHLYSSAFIVEKSLNKGKAMFTLHGAGWGHGVGLCQIGAAVMGAKGYCYKEILMHYFRGAELVRMY